MSVETVVAYQVVIHCIVLSSGGFFFCCFNLYMTRDLGIFYASTQCIYHSAAGVSSCNMLIYDGNLGT